MQKYRKNIAKLLLLIFSLFLIISFTVELFTITHDCIGDRCNICYEINFIKNIFDSLLMAFLMNILICKIRSYLYEAIIIKNKKIKLTPIKLKIKLIE